MGSINSLAKVVMVFMALVFVCACSEVPQKPSSMNNGEAQTTGPWVAEFEKASAEVLSDLAKAILADGNITDEEILQAKDTLRDCLQASGLTVYKIGTDGSLDTFLPSLTGESVEETGIRAQKLTEVCEKNIDWTTLAGLYNGVRINPNNIDPYVIMAECLVRVGIRPDGYSADDYAQEFETGAFFQEYSSLNPSEDADKFWACNSDPTNTR
ncbi:MAG: hypothetical protein LBG99_05980 [Propionibacteriaceae bacterium]|jgi:hypothetical protein|nr:hypothetical protein [Propionibacteriaceae bacterium]